MCHMPRYQARSGKGGGGMGMSPGMGGGMSPGMGGGMGMGGMGGFQMMDAWTAPPFFVFMKQLLDGTWHEGIQSRSVPSYRTSLG